MHCNVLKEKLKTIKENVDDLIRSWIKGLYTRKGVCKKDTIVNLTKKYKVNSNKRPPYRVWKDDEINDSGSKQNSKLTTITYKAKLIKKKLLTLPSENWMAKMRTKFRSTIFVHGLSQNQVKMGHFSCVAAQFDGSLLFNFFGLVRYWVINLNTILSTL